MEVDSVHSNIEKKLKGGEFFGQFDYLKVIQQARSNPSPFKVNLLKYNDFLNFSNGYYSSVRPGTKKDYPFVTDVCSFKYISGYTYYKLDYSK